MRALVPDLYPSDTELPGLVKRRVWSYPELQSHSVMVLTLRRLHLAPLAGEPKPEALAAIDRGIDLEKILGPLTTIIDMDAVRRVKLDLLTNSIVIEYAAAGHGVIRVTVVFRNAEDADACFSKLWRRLGESFMLTPYKRPVWVLARTPLTLLGGVLSATALLVFGLNVAEDAATARAAGGFTATALDAALGWVNWKTVCAVGGVLAAAVQVWLYRRLTQPPVRLELVRG
jgi:hypothetical protein